MNFRFFRKRLHLPNIRYFVGFHAARHFSCKSRVFAMLVNFFHFILWRKMM